MADDAVHVITTKSENLEQTLKDTIKGVMEGLPKEQVSKDSGSKNASMVGSATLLSAALLGSAFGAPAKDAKKNEQIVTINGHPYSKEVSGDSRVTTVQLPTPVTENGDRLDTVEGLTTAHGQALDIITRKIEDVITTRIAPLEQTANTLKTSVKVAQEGVNTLFDKQAQTDLKIEMLDNSRQAITDVVNDHAYYIVDQSQAQEEADAMAWDRYQSLSNRIEIQQNDLWALKNEIDVINGWISDNEDLVSKIVELQLDKERLDQVMRKVESNGHEIDRAMRVIEHVGRDLGNMHDSIKDNEVSVDYLMSDSSDSGYSVGTNSNFADVLRNAIISTIP